MTRAPGRGEPLLTVTCPPTCASWPGAGRTMGRPVTVELSGDAGGGGRIGGAGTGGTTSTVQVDDAKVSENAPEASVWATRLATRSPMAGVESVNTTPASGTGVVAPGCPSTACSTLPDAESSGCSWK